MAHVIWRARGIDGACSTVFVLWPICRLHEVAQGYLVDSISTRVIAVAVIWERGHSLGVQSFISFDNDIVNLVDILFQESPTYM